MSAQPKGLPRVDVLALIEREDELAALAAAVARLAERGAGGVVVVEAAAGLGKTVLLDRAARMAAGVGARVRRAAAGPLEREVAHDVLRALLETELCERAPQERARLLEGPAAAAGALLLEGEGDAADARIGHGVVALCAALGRERPLVLVVDDAQWCDRPSLEVLGRLARRIADLPVLLLLAHRPDDPGAARDLLALAGAAPAALTLRPAPLSVAGAARLIRRVAPDTAIHVCRQGHEAAAGNPWLLGELARGDGPGAGARQVVRERLAGLSAGARSLAVALAVLGAAAEREVVAAVAGLKLAALARASDEVAAAGLLRADRRGLVHPLVATAIAAELPTGTLDDLHRAAARCLADDGAITRHLLLCAPLGDPEVTAHLRRSAVRAWQDGDPHGAVTVLERALAERAPGDPRAELLARLSTASFDAGLPGAADRLAQALATAGHDDRIDILTGIAAVQAAPLVTLSAGEGAPETVLLDALVALPARHAERARRVDGLRVGSGEHRFAQAHRAAVALERGVPAAELARDALADGALLGEARRRPGFDLALGALIFSDQESEASAALEDLRAEAERRGSPRLRASAAHHAAVIALRAGRVIDAEAHGRVAGPAARAVLIAALAERGAFAEADALLGDPDDALLHARARLALARGDLDLAYADARAAGRLCAANPALTPWRSTAALALAHSGRRAAAARLADEELALAERFGAPLAILTALHARAVAEADATARLVLLRRGTALAATAPPSAAAIALLLEEGATLRRSGDRVEAREPLRRALALATAGGADLAAQRARRELVASGARPRRDQDEGAEALTPRQREICDLAAGGVTNRQIADRLFLSVKTVETHLAAGFRKLGVGSRAEIAAALSGASGSG
jgi:DNA-binding NarL/FixJ family response regulator